MEFREAMAWTLVAIFTALSIITLVNDKDCPACWCDTSDNVQVVYDVGKCPKMTPVTLENCSKMLREANEAILDYDYYRNNRR